MDLPLQRRSASGLRAREVDVHPDSLQGHVDALRAAGWLVTSAVLGPREDVWRLRIVPRD